MLFGQLQPAGLADVEVAPSVTVYSTVLNLPGRNGAEIASDRASVLGLCELVANRTLLLAAGNAHAICAMSCIASLASASVVVAVAIGAYRPT